MLEDQKMISALIRLMMPIFQEGFFIESRLGANVKDILCSELGVTPEFVDCRIATVFIDGKAVDNIETARLSDGCILTLSGAMPGLVGACMRKSGQYASLRSGISYTPPLEESAEKRGLVKVKIFNTMIQELGPKLLKQGVLVNKKQLGKLLDETSKLDTGRNATDQMIQVPINSELTKICFTFNSSTCQAQ